MFKKREEHGSATWKNKKGFAEKKEMHKATCAECNASCEVPFVPNGRKPILCRNCFKRDEGQAPRRFESRDSGRQSYGSKSSDSSSSEQLNQINAKLDMILRALKGGSEE